MTSRRTPRTRTTIFPAILIAGVALALTACGDDESANQPTAPVKQTYQPREPELGPLEDIDMDPRVQFPEQRAPAERTQAQAVARLASAIASGDNSAFANLIEPSYRTILTSLVDEGSWNESTSEIETVRVAVLESDAEMLRVGLAIQDARGAYLLAWSGNKSGDSWSFEPIAIEPQYAPTAADLDDAPLVSPRIAEAEFETAPVETEEKEEREPRRSSPSSSRGPRLPN